jgi:hypothetical protein
LTSAANRVVILSPTIFQSWAKATAGSKNRQNKRASRFFIVKLRVKGMFPSVKALYRVAEKIQDVCNLRPRLVGTEKLGIIHRVP